MTLMLSAVFTHAAVLTLFVRRNKKLVASDFVLLAKSLHSSGSCNSKPTTLLASI
ncbi:hypothetical protein GBAR_LOCUS4600 [Geodia barretti]|uniref:Uncharacterized protein n=1 Tax=Geodia barretti TaxID=519541 RepID=A0AA35W2Z6_GEOBA|nr:hypothetical protein GBAR_LOCUS4600 [Geodia barretti]